jgi:hypothetical protein
MGELVWPWVADVLRPQFLQVHNLILEFRLRQELVEHQHNTESLLLRPRDYRLHAVWLALQHFDSGVQERELVADFGEVGGGHGLLIGDY